MLKKFMQNITNRQEFVIVIVLALGYFIFMSTKHFIKYSLLNHVSITMHTSTMGTVIQSIVEIILLIIIIIFLKYRNYTAANFNLKFKPIQLLHALLLLLIAKVVIYITYSEIWGLFFYPYHHGSIRVIHSSSIYASFIYELFINSFFEEFIVIGYIFKRFENLKPVYIIAISTLLRVSYHTYQGWGSFFHVIPFGIIFGIYYYKYKNIIPIIIVHGVWDIIILVTTPFYHSPHQPIHNKIGWSTESTTLHNLNNINKEHLYGKVKSITYYYYSKKSEDTSKLIRRITYLFDTNGNKLNENNELIGWKPTSASLSYDASGKITELKSKDLDSIPYTFSYQYNNRARLTGCFYHKGKYSDSVIIKYKYDDRDNRVEEDYYNTASMGLITKFVYGYDSRGNQISEHIYCPDSNQNKIETYSYDENNNLTGKINYEWFNSPGQRPIPLPGYKEVYKYPEYDEKGNWLKKLSMTVAVSLPTNIIGKRQVQKER